MTDAIMACGVVLERDGNPIAEITNIDGVEMTRDAIDVTSHGSTDCFKEYIPGLKDTGEIKVEGNFIASDTNGQIGLEDDYLDGILQSFVLTFPTSITATWAFNAYVTSFKVGGFAVGDKLSFSATLKVSGEPTLAITSCTAPASIVVNGDNTTPMTLIPTFAAATYDYVSDGSADSEVTVTVTAGSADEITVNGSAVESGSPSQTISLTSGAITTITVVVHEDGKVDRTYVIRISSGL